MQKTCICRFGFTLSEVLITLGIIGVVAALTMPSLVANYKKKVTIVKLKKAYSILNQAFKMSEAFNGASDNWEDSYSIGADAYYSKYWAPYFSGATLCKTYSECGFDTVFGYKQLNGDTYPIGMSTTSNSRIVFYLPDGFLYAIFIKTGPADNMNKSSMIIIDINGAKKPNILGKDAFIFTRVNGKGILPYGYNLSSSAIEKSCSLEGDGTACVTKIMKDGWEIKY